MENSRVKLQQNLSKTLRSLRTKSGLSQSELAEKAGLSRSQYAYYEFGHIMPDLISLKKMAETLNVDISVFLYPETCAETVE